MMSLLFLLLAVSGTFAAQEQEFRIRSKQTIEISELNNKVDILEHTLHRLEAKLANQENVIREQNILLSRQRNMLLEQRAELALPRVWDGHRQSSPQGMLIYQQETAESGHGSPAVNIVNDGQTEYRENLAAVRDFRGESHSKMSSTDQSNTKSDFKPTDTLEEEETLSKFRHVSARSDDGDPLEAVVSHLSQDVTMMKADLQALKNTLYQQDTDIHDARSSVFVRWGSSQCSNSSELVYSGIMGGSPYTQTGAASNYMCLTFSPVLGAKQSSAPASLYGAEYETHDSHQNEDPVCSVCRSAYSTTVMIPGTTVCPRGWSSQYSGYLMAGDGSHAAASEFICVDSKMESRAGSADDHNGKLLYFVVTVCGSLPCQPYTDHAVMTCVVCSK